MVVHVLPPKVESFPDPTREARSADAPPARTDTTEPATIDSEKVLQRAANKRIWRMQLKRAQIYLGLPLTIGKPGSDSDPQAVLSQRLANSATLISIDLEAWEFNQRIITEIGFSMLDTAEIVGVPASLWKDRIHSYHFRIKENAHRVNKRHVDGCPDKFNFGASLTLSLREAVSELFLVFRPSPDTHVKPVLVGHNINSDIKYLEQIGFDVRPLVSDCIDTENLSRSAERNPNSRGLSKLLQQFGIEATNLHNAGNDARYTLEALIAIAVHETYHQPSPEEWELRKQAAIERAREEAERRVREMMDGWSSDDQDDLASGMGFATELSAQRLPPAIAGPRTLSRENRRFRGHAHAALPTRPRT